MHGKLLPQLLRHDWILNYFHLNASHRVCHDAVLSVLGFCLQPLMMCTGISMHQHACLNLLTIRTLSLIFFSWQ